MKRLLFVFLAGPLMAQNYVPPAVRTITWQTGSDIWNAGNLPNYTPVSCSATCDGVTDATSQINACISAATTGQAVVLPAGTCYINGKVRLKSNMSLRGAQPVTASIASGMPSSAPSITTINEGASGSLDTQSFSTTTNLTPSTSYATLQSSCSLSGSPNKGDTTLINNSTDPNCSVTAGSYIVVYGNDDPALIRATGQNGKCDWCGPNTGFKVATQIVKVTAVSGSLPSQTMTIAPGLYLKPDVNAETVPGPGGSGTVTEPAGAGFTKITFPTQKAGFENLRVQATGNIGASQIILLEGCLFCWVRNVETYNTGSSSGSAHVEMDYSYGDEIRDSYFHDGRSSASGANYGVYFQFINSDHKVENNILRHNRHAVVYQGGGSGTAILYNFMTDMYTDDTSYFGSARTSHGAFPFMNLWEGNVASHVAADDYWGSSAYFMFFRNWLVGGEPNSSSTAGTIPGFPPSIGFDAIDLYQGQPYYTFVDGVLGNSGLGSGISGNWTTSAQLTVTCTGVDNCGYDSPSAPAVYSYGGSAYGSVPTSVSTVLRQGNYDYKTLGVAYNDGGAGYTYQASYYYASKPSFLGSCPWPAFGSDVSGIANATNLPAYNTAMGTACASVSSGSSSIAGMTAIGMTVK